MIFKMKNFTYKGVDNNLIWDLSENDLYDLITDKDLYDIKHSFLARNEIKYSQIDKKHFYLTGEDIESLMQQRDKNTNYENYNLYDKFVDTYKINNCIDIDNVAIKDDGELLKICNNKIDEEFITDPISYKEKFYKLEIEDSNFSDIEDRLYKNPFLREFEKFDFVYRENDSTQYIQLYTSEKDVLILTKDELEDTLDKYKKYEYENDFEL